MIGRTKSLFSNERQFLRDSITTELECYRITADLVCIHGISAGSEIFFNGLGAVIEGQYFFQSEILFDISDGTADFLELVNR
jgi:hypothetical protein